MEVSKIDFCNKKVYNMKNNREKKDIIDKIFNNFSIDLTSKNFVFSNKLQNLLNHNNYFIRCITQGNRYFLYLTKFNNENYTLLIDSKLTDGFKYPKILIVNLGFDDFLYNNTLISGELVKLKNNNWTFLIDDILVYLNKNCKESFKERLKLIYQIFSKKYFYDHILNLFTIEINKFFNIKDRNDFFENYIPKLNYRVNGIQFVPNEPKFPVIDLCFKKNNNNYNKATTIDKTKKKNHKNTEIFKCNDNNTSEKYITFQLQKTTYQDIFNLHYYIEGTLKKHSIARIESLECSEMVNKLIKESATCNVECKYSQNFKKWIPVRKSQRNICNEVDINNYLKMNMN